MDVWKILNSISQTKIDLSKEDGFDKTYNSYMICRGLSYFPDTIEYANHMNMMYHLDNKLQYEYLKNIIRPRKRWSKWAKKKEDKSLEIIKTYYKCSDKKAIEYLRILTDKQLKAIKEYLVTGTE